MEYRKLAATEVNLSLIGVGTWAIGGGDWKYGWGPQDDKESIKAIHAALDLGVNWIDTAPAYGLGHAETVVGKVLKERKEKPFVATKCGLFQDKNREVYSDISEQSIRKEVEESLKRLGVECIDLYQIHWPNPSRDVEEAFAALLSLAKEGKILYPAVSNFSLEQLKRIAKLGMPFSLQSPFSLIRQELNYEIIPWCAENSVSVLAYSPLQCGLLTGKVTKSWINELPQGDWRRDNKYFKEPELSKNLEKIKKARLILEKSNLDFENPLMAASLQWVLRQSGVTSAIVGFRNTLQVEQVLNCLRTDLSQEILSEIGSIFR